MELKDLVGEHTLDAVDFSNEQVRMWGDNFEPCQVLRFRLDGVCYTATEDPSDGYRSSMKDIVVSEDAKMENVFPPLRVLGDYRTKGSYDGVDDILELYDAVTGLKVIEVGTNNVDDWYPGFVGYFNPAAMVHNI